MKLFSESQLSNTIRRNTSSWSHDFLSRAKGMDSEPAIAARMSAVLDEKLDVYNEILGQQKYLAGDVC